MQEVRYETQREGEGAKRDKGKADDSIELKLGFYIRGMSGQLCVFEKATYIVAPSDGRADPRTVSGTGFVGGRLIECAFVPELLFLLQYLCATL